MSCAPNVSGRGQQQQQQQSNRRRYSSSVSLEVLFGVLTHPVLFVTSPFSTGERQPAYAYAWAQTVEDGAVEIFAEAHRLVPDGVISGYDLHSTKPNQGQSDEPDGGIADSGVDADDVEFVEFSAFSRQEAEGWLGSVSTEELQGGGLHRHVSVPLLPGDGMVAAQQSKSILRCC